MKQKRLIWFLIAEAVACVLGAVFLTARAELFSGMFAFPFEQIGMGLRALSLSGQAGNAVAWVIYFALCLAPLLYLAVRVRKRAANPVDGLLALLSAMMFGLLYLMINPGEIGRFFPSLAMLGAEKAFLGGTYWSVVVAYAVLRMLRRFAGGDTQSRLAAFGILLRLVAVALVFVVFGSGMSGLFSRIADFNQANTDGASLFASHVFIWLQFIVGVLPHIMEIFILVSCMDLLSALSDDPYSENAVSAARKTGRWCKVSVIWIVLSQMGINLAQLLFEQVIRHSRFTVSIPILSIIFVFAALLLSGYFEKGRALKDENDSFV